MTRRRAAAYFAAAGLGAAAIAWALLQGSSTPPPEAPAQVVAPSSIEAEPGDPIGDDEQGRAPPTLVSPGDITRNDERDGGDAGDARLADVRRQMVEKVFARVGESLVADFAAKGLAPADAEVIVRRALAGFASCTLDAYRSVAGEKSFVAVLDAIEATLSDSDGPVVSAVVDVPAVQERAVPCLANVSQQAGIPFPR